MRRLALVLLAFFSGISLAHATCTTSYMPIAGSGQTPPRYFVCAAYADRPLSGLHAGDFLYVTTPIASYVATDSSTWSPPFLGITPTFNLGYGTLGTGILIPLDTADHTIAASQFFDHIRISQTTGANNTFTVGANGVVTGYRALLTLNSGSDSTAAMYGGAFGITNAGPGSSKTVHGAVAATGASTGVLVAFNAQIQPVATTNALSSAVQASLTSAVGAHDVVTGMNIGSSGDRFLYGIGSPGGPVPYGKAAFHAWMATGSSAGADFLRLDNNAGTTIYHVDKSGNAFAQQVNAATDFYRNGTALGYIASATRPNEALTNSAATDADFTSIYTIPANLLVANKWLHVRLQFKVVAGGTPATELFYVKLGSTKAYIAAAAATPATSLTRYYTISYNIIGTAAAGASVPVDVGLGMNLFLGAGSGQNTTLASVATNGTLTIVPGVTWGSNSNADTLTLLDALVEVLN